MSGFVRTIERTVARHHSGSCRAPFYMGRGSKLGVSNPRDRALIARLAREANAKGGAA